MNRVLGPKNTMELECKNPGLEATSADAKIGALDGRIHSVTPSIKLIEQKCESDAMGGSMEEYIHCVKHSIELSEEKCLQLESRLQEDEVKMDELLAEAQMLQGQITEAESLDSWLPEVSSDWSEVIDKLADKPDETMLRKHLAFFSAVSRHAAAVDTSWIKVLTMEFHKHMDSLY
eukprot:GEMP01019937.1.p1 GENE.GEMP01019937.1~~GEMP01019937.1.p1  ORF type:complete len:176 (+),score=44.25 GEMP01019937.1:283-810(+)